MYRKNSPPPTIGIKAKLKEVKLSRVLALFRGYRGQLAVILAVALAAALVGIVPPLIMKEIIDRALPEANGTYLWELVGGMVILPLASGLLGVWQNQLNNKVGGQSVMRDLRHSLFNNLQQQSMAFFTHSRSGEVIQRLTAMCRLFRVSSQARSLRRLRNWSLLP